MPARRDLPVQEIIRLYQEEHQSIKEISRRLKVAESAIKRRLIEADIPIRNMREAVILKFETGRKKARYWKGKKQPREIVAERIAKISGPNHYNWKGGIDRREYRKKVQKEKCADCGSRQNLGIHHKDLDHYNDDPDNLEILCVSCHMSLHAKLWWAAKKGGKEPPKSNAPTGWDR